MGKSVKDISFKSIKLELYTTEMDACIGSATGFFCRYKEKIFLVTNWHVVSGKNFQTNEIILDNGAVPGYLKTFFSIYNNQNVNKVEVKKLELYLDESNQTSPNWFEHPTYKGEIDVAVLLVNDLLKPFGEENIKLLSFDIDAELAKTKKIQPMDEVFIIGFPLQSNLMPNQFPIYKRGSIATEPEIFNKKPIFFVDGKTKKGMSGSPVIFKNPFKIDDVKLVGNQFKLTTTEGRIDLVGIYSGRERDEGNLFEAELGIVWHLECIVTILEHAIQNLKSTF